MPSDSRNSMAWLKRRAENVIVVLIAIMFISFLLQIGFVRRTPKGRQMTAAAYQHLGLDQPEPPTDKTLF